MSIKQIHKGKRRNEIGLPVLKTLPGGTGLMDLRLDHQLQLLELLVGAVLEDLLPVHQ